jgi:ABC-type nitrate/sulfonate/bicarbonate transport system permease component
VAGRICDDFWSAPALAYYGLGDADLCGNLLYTAENVALAVAAGAALGIATGSCRRGSRWSGRSPIPW